MREYNTHNETKPKRLNEIKQLNREFNDLTQALDSEKEKQSRMIASVSHDIKTPLTSIMGYAEQLKKGNLSNERQKKYVDTIYAKALSIKEMIEGFDDYLSYNNIGSSAKTEKTTQQFFNIISVYYLDDLKRNNVSINLKNLCSTSKILVNDSSMLRVIGNLIDNSLKHKSNDKKLLLEFKCEDAGKFVKFTFRDNGEGVEEDKLQKIFEPFYTTDESRRAAVSGLGLSICYEIVTEHGGKIWAENSKDGGFAVCFTLCKS